MQNIICIEPYVEYSFTEILKIVAGYFYNLLETHTNKNAFPSKTNRLHYTQTSKTFKIYSKLFSFSINIHIILTYR